MHGRQTRVPNTAALAAVCTLLITLTLVLCVHLALRHTILAQRDVTMIESFEPKPTPRARLATYGNAAYQASRQRLVGEAHDSGLFALGGAAWNERTAATLVPSSARETRRILDTCKRGNGYWLWKPLVVHAELERLAEGEVLVWADAGCVLDAQHADELRDRLLRLTEDQPVDLAVLPNHTNAQRCTGGAAELVAQTRRPAFWRSDQAEASRILLLKSPKAVELVEAWATAALQTPHLFTDEPSHAPNQPEFVEHRHDQAVLSCLMFDRELAGTPEAGWRCLVAARRRRG